MAAHLAPGGLAVVDVWLPDADDLARYDGRLGLEYVRADPETGSTVTKLASALHDAATGVVRSHDDLRRSRVPAGRRARWMREIACGSSVPTSCVGFAEAAGLVVEAARRRLRPRAPRSWATSA